MKPPFPGGHGFELRSEPPATAASHFPAPSGLAQIWSYPKGSHGLKSGSETGSAATADNGRLARIRRENDVMGKNGRPGKSVVAIGIGTSYQFILTVEK